MFDLVHEMLPPGATAKKADIRRVQDDYDNVRAALTYWLDRGADATGAADNALELAGAMGHYWYAHGLSLMGSDWLERALAQAPEAPAATPAQALLALGIMSAQRQQPDRAMRLLTRARELYQEGLVLPPVRLTDEVWQLFLANTRNPDERRGGLLAQVSAHRLATQRIDELCARRGRDRVAAAIDELYAYSERMVRAAIAQLPDGRRSAEDVLESVDGDLTIRATVEVDGEEVIGRQAIRAGEPTIASPQGEPRDARRGDVA